MFLYHVVFGAVAVGLFFKRVQNTNDNADFLKRMMLLFVAVTAVMLVYWIDPQGWKGIIPLNISMALTLLACSIGTSGLYFIASGLISTLGKISPALAETMEKGDRVKRYAINIKNVLDCVAFLLFCIFPEYTWLLYGLFGIWTSLCYSFLTVVTTYCGFYLVKEMEGISQVGKSGKSFGDTVVRIKRYLRDTVAAELVIRPLVIAVSVWWLVGKYNPSNYYDAPSFGMNLFINFSAVLDSLVLTSMLQLYFTLGYGNQVVETKETFVMMILSRLFVPKRKSTITTQSQDVVTSGQSLGQA